jgi:hypothetical protein
MYLIIIKITSDKSIANIVVNKEELKTFSLKSGMREGVHFYLELGF